MTKTKNIIDLRSDTVTKPTPEMLAAMLAAPVGDDVFGDDPSVNELEAEVAELLGFEAALFTPTGTMANQIAINLHCRPGEAIIAEQDSHVYVLEAGAAAALSGVQFSMVPRLDRPEAAGDVQAAFRPDNLHNPTSRLLIVENTHNRAAGRALGLTELAPLKATARELGLALHCDGARLWNAAVATETSEAQLVAGFDSVSVCFSKGLGAPVGSAMVGTRAFVERGRKVRKRLGGGMRQAGYLAAAALYGVRHHRARLAEDHRRAGELNAFLSDQVGRTIVQEVSRVERPTNMVYFRTPQHQAEALAQALAAEHGIRLIHVGGGWHRCVFHLHIEDTDMPVLFERFGQAFKAFRP